MPRQDKGTKPATDSRVPTLNPLKRLPHLQIRDKPKQKLIRLTMRVLRIQPLQTPQRHQKLIARHDAPPRGGHPTGNTPAFASEDDAARKTVRATSNRSRFDTSNGREATAGGSGSPGSARDKNASSASSKNAVRFRADPAPTAASTRATNPSSIRNVIDLRIPQLLNLPTQSKHLSLNTSMQPPMLNRRHRPQMLRIHAPRPPALVMHLPPTRDHATRRLEKPPMRL